MKAGDKHSRLTLLCKHSINGKTYWDVFCQCGVEKRVRADGIKSGAVKSCGCLSAEKTAERSRKHGATNIPGYNSWLAMMHRCYSPNVDSYKYYGAKGITVCDQWHDPAKFLLDMGPPTKGQQIDRINTSGNYEPSNCRWASPKENINNRSNTKRITAFGKTMSVSDWSAKTGIPTKTIHVRLCRSWSEERAISQPLKGNK